jgi:hypothetical protein
MLHGYVSTKVVSGSCIFLLLARTGTCIMNMLKHNIGILNFKYSTAPSQFPLVCAVANA